MKTASSFLALLALVCLAATVVAAIVLGAARMRPDHPAIGTWRDDLRRSSLGLAWLVAAVSTGGSLYLSEVAHFTPCPLCWYQRIVMYPLVLILAIAAVRRDRSIRIYVLPIAAIGVVISAYHSWIQAFPPADGTTFCTLEAPCTERFIWEFGFVSIPFMALCGFLFVLVMMLAAGPGGQEGAQPGDDGPTGRNGKEERTAVV